jgi:2,3-bisphosphoglycerate-dependent phosphoglycerate mutase
MELAHAQILLVRHAEPVRPGTPGFAEDDRPLPQNGLQQADELAQSLAAEPLVAIYSSPYLRARQTAEPIAARHGLAVESIDDLRERMLSPDSLPIWREELQRSFCDFDYAPPGGETSRAAQIRVLNVLGAVARRHPAASVVLASHGNLITLALAAVETSIGFDFWLKLPMPALYRLRFEKNRWRIVSGPNLGPAA